MNRRGFLVGFGIGGGAITCSGSFVDCGWHSGATFELHVGGMLNDRTGLMYDSSGFGLAEDDEAVGLGVHTLAVQHWTSPRGWIKGGAGFASATCSFCGDYDYGLGLMGATGVELVQHPSFVLDLQGRFLFSRFDGVNFYKPTVTLGFNWY